MPANKVKGLLKGLRYISQVFDNDKEPEMQIGHPTDVKHVAHIGCDGTTDGQSENSPTWMREFSPPPSFSGPLTEDGEVRNISSSKAVYDDFTSSQRSTRPPAPPSQDVHEKPRSSRRQPSTNNTIESRNSKSDKPKSSRRSKSSQTKASSQSNESPAGSISELPKRLHRKKTKEGGGGSVKSSPSRDGCNESSYACTFSDPGPGTDELPPLKSPLKSCGGQHNENF